MRSKISDDGRAWNRGVALFSRALNDILNVCVVVRMLSTLFETALHAEPTSAVATGELSSSINPFDIIVSVVIRGGNGQCRAVDSGE